MKKLKGYFIDERGMGTPARILCWIVLLFCITILTFGCTSENAKTDGNGRIKEVEGVVIDGYYYAIINVDGQEYLINAKGGIQPLNKPKEE